MRNTVLKIALLLGLLAAIASVVSWLFPARRPLVAKPLPHPNAYEIFVTVGRTVPAPRNLQRFNHDELAIFVASHSNELQSVRSAFQIECQVPVNFSREYLLNHSKELLPLRALGQALAAEGRLAELENRPVDAAKADLDVIQLGIIMREGGLVIDAMMGTAVEGLGITQLKKIVSELDATGAREAATRLETLDEHSQPWKEIMDSEREFVSRYPASFKERFSSFVASRTTAKPLAKAENRFNEIQMERRQLVLQLAARAFEAQKGTPPKGTTDLIPAYLKRIPLDPVTGTNLVYR